ncbi:MAG: hypothetical protein JWP31_1220 [Aeromicrobium sp.]|nr:hypothetical protein [Aeromicrobium sp.]
MTVSQQRLPPAVYRRRRLTALAIVIAVVIALVWGGSQLVGGDDRKDPKTTARPSPTAAATSTAAAAKVDGVVDVSLVSASTACDVEKIRVTPSVRPQQMTRGTVDIGLVVSSTSKTACTLEPADADLLTVISANGTPVWDSTVCKQSPLDEPVAISPRWASFVTVEWNGRGSGSACSGKEDYASPGSYTVQVGTLGGEPGKTSFTLDARPAPKKTRSPAKPTKTPSRKPTPKPSASRPAG